MQVYATTPKSELTLTPPYLSCTSQNRLAQVPIQKTKNTATPADIDAIRTYSWGSCVLGFLYRRCARRLWELITEIQADPLAPLGKIWCTSFDCSQLSTHTLVTYRDQLDFMSSDEGRGETNGFLVDKVRRKMSGDRELIYLKGRSFSLGVSIKGPAHLIRDSGAFLYMGSGFPIDDLVESGTVRLLDWNDSMTDIQLGMRFVDKVQAVSAVQKYSISVGREYRVLKSKIDT
ncbi:hypothetical protein M9H77_12604 [Catharanthus roseus]|uniref:Uncharacterized protein n=1 Tax=Catharanthus roseus TaxID=4058 RepID=A0ACC0BHY0_CATRO|nr:hypothetical protein M9H77_12604 [Catharanthus roseus]